MHARMVRLYPFFLLIGLVLGFTAFAQTQNEDSATVFLHDVTIAGNSDSARITVWSSEPLNPNTFLISDPDSTDMVDQTTYLVISADIPLGPLANYLDKSVNQFLARRAGIRHWRPFNGDLLLELDWPLTLSRAIHLEPVGDISQYRTIIDLRAISDDTARSIIATQTAKYRTYLGRQETIHLAAATSPKRQDSDKPEKNSKPIGPAEEQRKITPDQPVTITANIPGKKALTHTNEGKRDYVIRTPTIKSDAGTAKQRQKSGPFVIVIDPGHGGYDPGAVKFNVNEKDVVLKAALELKALLVRNKNYRVYLTRDTDTFISLEKRVSLARDWRADLFISIHADSISVPTIRGASVYTLSEKGVRRSKHFATQNNWDLPEDVTDNDSEVANILTDFAQRETLSRSAVFADSLLEQLRRVTKLVNNSHRNAGFVVLFASDVPAVLLEMGYLSNKQDAQKLSTKKGRKPIIIASKKAIDTYYKKTYAG